MSKNLIHQNCPIYEGWLLCSETGNPARAEVLHVKSLREQACQSQNIKTGPRKTWGEGESPRAHSCCIFQTFQISAHLIIERELTWGNVSPPYKGIYPYFPDENVAPMTKLAGTTSKSVAFPKISTIFRI